MLIAVWVVHGSGHNQASRLLDVLPERPQTAFSALDKFSFLVLEQLSVKWAPAIFPSSQHFKIRKCLYFYYFNPSTSMTDFFMNLQLTFAWLRVSLGE